MSDHSIITTTNGVVEVSPADQQHDTWEYVINQNADVLDSFIASTDAALAGATLPTLATVATSGSYTDLTNKPTIPAAQVNSDWNATTGLANILNKPTIPTLPTLATVATSGSYTDLTNKPTIPTLPTLATVATSGSYTDLTNTPTIPTNITTQGNTFNAANQLVQLDSTANLPPNPVHAIIEGSTESVTNESDTATVSTYSTSPQTVMLLNFTTQNTNVIGGSITGSVNITIDSSEGSISSNYQFDPLYGGSWSGSLSNAIISGLNVQISGSYTTGGGSNTVNVWFSAYDPTATSLSGYDANGSGDQFYMSIDNSGNISLTYYPANSPDSGCNLTFGVWASYTSQYAWNYTFSDNGMGWNSGNEWTDPNSYEDTVEDIGNGYGSSLSYSTGQFSLPFVCSNTSIVSFDSLVVSYNWVTSTQGLTNVVAGSIVWDGSHFLGFNGSNLLQLDN